MTVTKHGLVWKLMIMICVYGHYLSFFPRDNLLNEKDENLTISKAIKLSINEEFPFRPELNYRLAMNLGLRCGSFRTKISPRVHYISPSDLHQVINSLSG